MPDVPGNEVLLNVTAVPGQTVVSLAMKETTGNGYTLMTIDAIEDDTPLYAVSVTV